MTWTLLSRRRETTGTGASSVPERGHAEGLQARKDILSEPHNSPWKESPDELVL